MATSSPLSGVRVKVSGGKGLFQQHWSLSAAELRGGGDGCSPAAVVDGHGFGLGSRAGIERPFRTDVQAV
jgi:hypothetical protein